jgi:hypothetical protein
MVLVNIGILTSAYNVFSENVLAEISRREIHSHICGGILAILGNLSFFALKISLFSFSLIPNAMLVMYFTTEK